MCCFSQNISFVRNTRIFAAPAGKGWQTVVYQMHLGAPSDLAMILPLPVARDSGPERPLEFINLEEYPDFFDDLAKMFLGRSYGDIAVERVGAYDASFVPTVKDFARVDERFRLPDGIWEELGDYADSSFAVFKLREGEKEVHPMAFRFRTSDPIHLFFPAVHIHDGQVHETAHFDHTLYSHISDDDLLWRESETPASNAAAEASGGLIHANRPVYQRVIQGEHKNEDIRIDLPILHRPPE